MSVRQWIPALVLACGVGATAGSAGQGDDTAAAATLEVTHRARALNPGEVVAVAIASALPLRRVEGEGFGRPLVAWPHDDPRQWSGLVGIPLDTKPASYTVRVRATADGARTAAGSAVLAVQSKQFATRRLQVAENFIDPPEREVARILEEARRINDTFARLRTERLWSGPFIRPVPGDATSSFGRLSILNGEPGSRHQGADLRAVVGTPVRAPNGGEVVLASELYFSGNTVILDHGYGLFSLFGHLSRIGVAEGRRVAAGELIGEAGATGRVTGPHLHWAVRVGNVSVDPLSLMAATEAMK